MNDYAQRVCIFCLPKRDRRTGETYQNCDLCVGRCTDRWCECACEWTRLDLGGEVTQPINDDDDYAEDAAATPAEDLPEPADPAQIPPDEGDAGAAK